MASEDSARADIGASPEDGVLLTVEEVARRLRLGRTFVYRLITTGELESVKVGRLRRVPAECLVEYVATLRATRNGSTSAA